MRGTPIPHDPDEVTEVVDFEKPPGPVMVALYAGAGFRIRGHLGELTPPA